MDSLPENPLLPSFSASAIIFLLTFAVNFFLSSSDSQGGIIPPYISIRNKRPCSSQYSLYFLRSGIHSFNGLIGFFGRFVGVTTSLNQATTPALFGFLNQFLLDGEGRRQFLFLIFLVLFFVLAEAVSYSKTLNLFSVKYRWVRAVLYFSAVLAIMNLGVTHEIPFIYFQF